MESQTPVTTDPVNHPAHYTSLGAKCKNCNHPIECIDITELFDFTSGNAIKYIWRAPFKNQIEDLKKAAWYLNREIARVEGVTYRKSPVTDYVADLNKELAAQLTTEDLPKDAVVVNPKPIKSRRVGNNRWHVYKATQAGYSPQYLVTSGPGNLAIRFKNRANAIDYLMNLKPSKKT